jgi:3-phosphoglycerate kinase
MWIDDLDIALSSAGVTTNDRNTKAYERIKKAIKDNPEIIIGSDLGEALANAAKMAKELKVLSTGTNIKYIDDKDIRNAVAAFNTTLNVTKDVFGEKNMTEAVICKAIEAGSYIAYRAIMGEAAAPSKRY